MNQALLEIGLKTLRRSLSKQRAATLTRLSYVRGKTAMPARVSRRLVIDASVARSAGGEEATFPTSKHCRDFLKAVLAICHRIVMTPRGNQEWREHASKFTRTWRTAMVSRKKVDHTNPAVSHELRDRIERVIASEKDREAILKDFHLIEAALMTDRTVISLDEEARRLFVAASRNLGGLRNVMWVNPDKPQERPVPWLENGAKPEKRRLLGFRSGGS